MDVFSTICFTLHDVILNCTFVDHISALYDALVGFMCSDHVNLSDYHIQSMSLYCTYHICRHCTCIVHDVAVPWDKNSKSVHIIFLAIHIHAMN